ncbi:glycerol-3-phosphate 1-O-acyltransferase PlsY [Pseudoroseicyclus aestuarii]|uniref:Glycerol-3-phosphate acyltransferase n=1 Tax=Pseudoroseicyclus aestuarii TaxID=1795041 RepID=A0A318SSE3_9RHOB|nr:glycerol-3-phosphate 1-O-acyltransferase PlsY [Pseudoroseicyclus aestuarii]PYE84750.1 acyl-phosphate glycerol-3-phosphate acyltransferase [Pseudoroseicyclus aestuarii]
MTAALWAVIGYLLGSIPFGVILMIAAGKGDPRKSGSGNIGATNVARTGGRSIGLATLLLDGGKGALAVLLARHFGGEAASYAAATAAFLGHCFPVWLRFRGGKGVATHLGLLLALAWPVGLLACATWAAGFFATRISSLSALIAAALAPLWALLLGRPEIALLALILAVLIYIRHVSNIRRLLNGTEPRAGKGR